MSERLPLDRRFGRRALLAGLGAGAGAAALAACMPGRGRANPTTNSAPAGAGGIFASPAELVSAEGVLEVTLVAAAAMVPWAGGTRYALTYNGTTPGPTWRVRPGDLVRVTLQNRLDRPTNLHTHGLHVSPSGASDNIFVMVEPGQEHTYEYRLPTDHPSGTFWYHPHHHGEVASQLIGGLAGVIVVEDAVDASLAATTERVLVLADPRIGADAGVLSATTAQQLAGREGDVIVVNGLAQPVLSAVAGTTERWRIVNASPSRYYSLSVTGAAMQLIASDHGRLEAPRAVESLLITPGQRAEVLVPLATPGTVTLTTIGVGRGGMGMGMGGMGAGSSAGVSTRVLTVDVAPGAGSLAALGAVPWPVASSASVAVDGRRTVTLGAMGMAASAFVIDGRSFGPDRVDITARLGTTEEWTLRNASMMDHPFHLHVWPFRVVGRTDATPVDPGWRDTVNVPAGHAVTIRLRFADFAGRTVYHCHILDHEDLGMMGTIEVV